MIEQVNSVNFCAQSKYKEAHEPWDGSFVMPDSYLRKYAESDIFDDPVKVRKKHKVIKIVGGVLAGLLLIVGSIGGISKATTIRFDKLKEYLINKSEEVTLSSGMAIFFRKMVASMRRVAEKARGFNNFVSFKDIWFKRRITDKVPILKRISRNITKAFDNIGLGVVKGRYAKSVKRFGRLNHLYTNMEGELLKDGDKIVEIKGISKTKAEWAEYLAQRRGDLMKILEENFSETGILRRNHRLKGLMSELGNNVWDASFGTKGKMREKDTYFTFWADKFLAKNKLKYANEINRVRSSISFSRVDKAKMCEEILYSGKKFIHPQDVTSEKMVREINKLLSEYRTAAKNNPAKAEEIIKKISVKLDEYGKIMEHGKGTFGYDENILTTLLEQNKQIKNIIASSKHGCVDEINEIYKVLLEEKEYKQVKQASVNAVNSLDSAIKKESNDYFDKLRDWTLGAAPTDVIGVLSSFATMGAALALTSDKEKRKSVILKAGIPALGGIGVMMFMTARLTSGIKCLGAGIASSIVLNQIGKLADKKRKQIVLARANAASQAEETEPDSES